ncbi:hypothetical protein BV22DRAFT_39085 [Leucogyrophana mollusca]|uniref:Uncharacterized protein n=1 Tax=Leucogyrophana mollusca TaxID=85980 RepID=A0ACB8C1C9_9AGAM|nr:hypothetical protein BV22DRAFT_39085 [Leucogyrophana mollusca]
MVNLNPLHGKSGMAMLRPTDSEARLSAATTTMSARGRGVLVKQKPVVRRSEIVQNCEPPGSPLEFPACGRESKTEPPLPPLRRSSSFSFSAIGREFEQGLTDAFTGIPENLFADADSGQTPTVPLEGDPLNDEAKQHMQIFTAEQKPHVANVVGASKQTAASGEIVGTDLQSSSAAPRSTFSQAIKFFFGAEDKIRRNSSIFRSSSKRSSEDGCQDIDTKDEVDEAYTKYLNVEIPHIIMDSRMFELEGRKLAHK